MESLEQLHVDASQMCGVTLSAQESMLALYTPQNEVHTRSVLLAPMSSSSNEYALLDNLSFVLAITVSSALDEDDLLRFMIRSYCYRRYDAQAQQQRGEVYEASVATTSSALLDRLREIDARNATDYETCMDSLTPWKKKQTPLNQEEEEAPPEMYNIKIVRSVQRLLQLRGKEFVGETQYRITFDNHLALTYFVARFRREVTIRNETYRVRLLDPIDPRVLFPLGKDVVPEEQYLESQICALYQGVSLMFSVDEALVVCDGLLWGATLPAQTIEQRLANGEMETGGRLHLTSTINQEYLTPLGRPCGKYRLQVRYLTQFIQLSRLDYTQMTLYYFDYNERKKRPLSVTRPESSTQQEQKKKKSVTQLQKEEEKKTVRSVKGQTRLECFYAPPQKRPRIDS